MERHIFPVYLSVDFTLHCPGQSLLEFQWARAPASVPSNLVPLTASFCVNELREPYRSM